MSAATINFVRLARNLPVGPVLAELTDNAPLWHVTNFRESYPGSSHADAQSILLRWLPTTPGSVIGDEPTHYEAAERLPASVALAVHARKLIGGSTFGRIMLTRLPPGGQIHRHADEGAYAERFQRFHVCLDADHGSRFECGDESVHMAPGELWWFNHQIPHQVVNAGERNRLHLIVDMLAPRSRVANGGLDA